MIVPDEIKCVLGNICYLNDDEVVGVFGNYTSGKFRDFYINGTRRNKNSISSYVCGTLSEHGYFKLTDQRREIGSDINWLLTKLMYIDGILIHTSLLNYYNGKPIHSLKPYNRFKLTQKSDLLEWVPIQREYNKFLPNSVKYSQSQMTLIAYAHSLCVDVDMGRFQESNMLDGVFIYNDLVSVSRDDMDALIDNTTNDIVKNILMGLVEFYDRA